MGGREGGKCSAPDCEDRLQPRLNCCPRAHRTVAHTTTISLFQHCSTTISIYSNVNIINMKEDILGIITVYARL